MARNRLVLVSVAAAFAGAANAQEQEPDLSFLEYLGSWQEGDEEWLVVADMDEELAEDDEASAKAKDEKADETNDE
jgi:hypothetical protein